MSSYINYVGTFRHLFYTSLRECLYLDPNRQRRVTMLIFEMRRIDWTMRF